MKMGKIYCVMGKSSSGKDTIYSRLMSQKDFNLKKIIPYTTRPIREGEVDGENYHFCTEDQLKELETAGKIIELRAYDTVYGVWKYFTVDDGQIDLDKNSYMLIGTLDTYTGIREYFGKDAVVPIYVEVEDGERLQRALNREKLETEPKYAEMCRRFLADSKDFSEENLAKAQIDVRFQNLILEDTIQNVRDYISKN